jgi:hypothetical protein
MLLVAEIVRDNERDVTNLGFGKKKTYKLLSFEPSWPNQIQTQLI